jgi:hypothetical protein
MAKKIVSVLLLLAVAAAVGWLFVCVRPSASPVGGFYTGKLADGHAIQLTMITADAQPKILAQIEGNPYSVTLDLKTNTERQLEFDCGPYSEAERWSVTGLTLEKSDLPAILNGRVFTPSATNGLAYTGTKVATMEKFSREIGVHILHRGGGKTFTATWPGFRDGVPFHELLSQRFAADALGEAGTFTTGSFSVMWEGFKDGGASWDWEGSLDVRIVWLATNLVSLCENRYEFSGGAHGESIFVGRNFILAGGKAREFKLGELFRSAADWTNVLSAACLRELRAQKAAFTLDTADPSFKVKGFSAADLASFNVDGSGLIIHFSDYAVAPHAEGLFDVLLPWPELKPLLAPDGPARQFLK